MEENKKQLPNLQNFGLKRTQKFLSIVLTLVALSFFGFFAVNPTISTIVKLKKELADSQFVSQALDTKIKNLSELRKQYTLIQSDLPIIIDAVPQEPDAHSLAAQIQTIAKEKNIRIKKLQSSEVEVLKNDRGSSKPYYSYSFSVAGQGSLQDILGFIKFLTNMQRIINIDTFSITSLENQSLGLNITGLAFFKE